MAIPNYTDIEEAIKEEIVSHFSDYLTADFVDHNLDRVWENMIEHSQDCGVYLELGEGRRIQNPDMPLGRIWQWETDGIFIVRFRDSDQIEDKVREIAGLLASLFQQNPRLGGVVSYVYINLVDRPQPVTINDIASYWFGFEIQSRIKAQ